MGDRSRRWCNDDVVVDWLVMKEVKEQRRRQFLGSQRVVERSPDRKGVNTD
jgi:hypothetical protein